MRPFHALIPFSEAKRVIMESIFPTESTEEVRLEDCLGRVMAQDVIARLAHPPFNRSAMDGYAVKARETFGASRSTPRVFNMIGTQLAGSRSDFHVRAGQCVQIATGARMPRGADAVVMVEEAEREHERLEVFKPVYPQANVSKRGEDIDAGELVLEKECVLDAAKIGVLASQGLATIEVYRRPRVAVLSTGEEIAQIGGKLKQGQIYDINSYTVSAIVRKSGGLPSLLGITPDDVNSLKSAVSRAVDCDMVVLSGGSSVGERDLFFQVLQGLGEVLFHGVQIKPGKPTVFGRIDDKPVFGMPGYPTSCLLNAYLLLAPAIRKMAHLPPLSENRTRGRLAKAVSGSLGRRQFLPVRLDGNAVVVVFKESGAITSMSRADGYIEIAENIDLLEKDQEVDVTLF
jgi:molybdopterin molybdotransferase